MVEGGKERGVHLFPQGLGGLHRIGADGDDQQQGRHGRRAAQKGHFQNLALIDGIRGALGYRGAVQLPEEHVLKDVFRHAVVVFQHDFQGAEGVRRGVGGDAEHQQVGVGQHRGGEGAGQRRDSHLTGGHLAEHIALKKLGEGVGNLGGNTEIGEHRGIAAALDADSQGGAGGILGLIEVLYGGEGQHHGNESGGKDEQSIPQ